MSQSPYHHGNLRNELLEAGERLLETVGIDGLSLRGLARETGVSHTAPYRHFRDKAELLAALAARGFTRLVEVLGDAASSQPKDAKARFLAGCQGYIELGLAHPAMYRLMFGQPWPGVGSQPELAASGHAAFEALVASMAEGQEAGVFRDVPVESLAIAVWAMVHGLTELGISGRLEPCGEGAGGVRRLGAEVCALLLLGLQAHGPQS